MAVIVAVPSPAPRTSPEGSTVATGASLDDQVNTAPSTTWPVSSYASATSRSVSPGATESMEGDTVTEPADCLTFTCAPPAASPAAAVTVAAPLRTAVTNPDVSTTATVVSALDHATGTPSIARPIWSRTSAVSCVVCPSAASTTVSGVTATVVGTGATTVNAPRPVISAAVAVTCTSPAPIPVTSPDVSTTATSVSADAHTNSAAAITCPFASVAVAARRNVSPSKTVAESGATATALTTCATVTVALPEASPEVAAIVAVPLATAVTSPDASTVATESSPDSHENSAPSTECPFASNAAAVSRNVSPRAAKLASAGTAVTELTTCATVTVALPEASPEVAAIVAVPLATAVTSPVASTMATASSPDSHENSAPSTECPFASNAAAVIRNVSPRAAKLASAGTAVTELTTCATVTVALPEASPEVAAIVAVPLATAVTSPVASTMATASSPDSHENSAPSTECPFASNAAAVIRNVSPRAAKLASAGTAVTELTTCATVTVALPEA